MQITPQSFVSNPTEEIENCDQKQIFIVAKSVPKVLYFNQKSVFKKPSISFSRVDFGLA
jgi:hypothetical protein